MDDDGSTIKAYGRGALSVARCRSFSLSLSLLLSPSMIPFRSPFPFFSPRKTNYPSVTVSSHRETGNEKETRWKTRNVRTTNYPWIHRANNVYECGNIRALLPLPALGLHGREYTGCPVICECIRQGRFCDKQRELNFSSIRSRVKSNLESV